MGYVSGMEKVTRLKGHHWISRKVLLLLLALGVAACAGQPAQEATIADFQRERAQQARVDDLNERLALQRHDFTSVAPETTIDSYRLGRGDLVEVIVLGVPELSREVRVDGNGAITLPLIGEVKVSGETITDASTMVAERYAESYLRDPQVSLLVKEFRSQEITVLGSVKQPKVYAVQRRMGVLEVLAMAGGVTENAGRNVYVSDRVRNPDNDNELIQRNLILNLDELIQGGSEELNIMLGDGAVINVPEAGVVYVEGAVERPGVYSLQRDTTVLKAIAMAGGLQYEAKKSGINVLRASNGEMDDRMEGFDIDFIRQNPHADIELKDGDVVVVETDTFKALMQGLIQTTRGFFGFGYTLNR